MTALGPLTVSRLRHDLRTYVNHLQGYGEMILETVRDEGPAQLADPVEHLLGQGKQLLDVIARNLPTNLEDLSSGVLEALIRELRAPAERAESVVEELIAQADAAGAAEIVGDLRKIKHAVDDMNGFLASRLVQRSETAATAAADPIIAPGIGARILIVDDIAGNRDLLRRRLEREGHHVVMAGNGKEALDRIAAGGLDLVLLDILMPEMDGYQVLAHVKSTPAGRELPVIMISSLDEIDSVVRCIEMGAEDFLPKPFDPVLLRARVNACLQKKRYRDQELEYLHNVALVTAAAVAVEAGGFDEEALDAVAQRTDALGQLARVFQRMGREVQAREARLKTQVQQLKIEIDEARKVKQVQEVTESDYFQALQKKAGELRRRAKK
jgi:two-component system cell cycle response regulator